MHAPYVAAAVQFEPQFGDKAANIARLTALVEEAAAAGARLIVMPEMATVGYCWYNRAEVAPYAEPIPGPTTDHFAALAARHNAYVAVGLAEVDPRTGVFYNSVALVGPAGLVGVYRKTHPFIADVRWAKDGDLGLPVWETDVGQLGALICMDACFFEPARVLALKGAGVLLLPTNWLEEHSPSAQWMARAYENGCYVIAANRWGAERGVQFSGGSAIIGPDGQVLAARDTGDGIVLAEIDPARQTGQTFGASADGKLAARRPDLYGDLVLRVQQYNPHAVHGLYDLPPLPAGRRSRIAVGQFAPIPSRFSANSERVMQLVQAANADVVVLPELALTGRPPNAAEARRYAAAARAALPALENLARHTRVDIIVGLVEEEGGNLYNSAVLFGPRGLVGTYRQVHVAAADREWATPGDSLQTFDLFSGRTGILIGHESRLPEPAMALALRGADMIAAPALLDGPVPTGLPATAVPLPAHVPSGADPHHFHLWRVRAWDTSTYIALASGNPEIPSGVFGPLTEAGPDQALVTDPVGTAILGIDTREARGRYSGSATRCKELLAVRQTMWYDPLVTVGG